MKPSEAHSSIESFISKLPSNMLRCHYKELKYIQNSKAPKFERRSDFINDLIKCTLDAYPELTDALNYIDDIFRVVIIEKFINDAF
jgi:hypothetical protein